MAGGAGSVVVRATVAAQHADRAARRGGQDGERGDDDDGTIVAAVGTVVALLSLFVLDVWTASGIGITLGDIAAAPDGAGINGLAAAYAGFGRFLALLVIAAAILAVLQLPALAATNARLPLIAAGTAGVFALWHLVALFVAPDGAGPAVTGVLGVLGLAALAAAPFLRQPVGTVK